MKQYTAYLFALFFVFGGNLRAILISRKNVLLYFFTLFFSISSFGQMKSKEYNFRNFSQVNIEITEEMYDLIPKEFHNHPEFGKVAYNAPCDNCFELIHKRTDSTKLYVEHNSNGTHFYSQAIYGLFHYEKEGRLLTYDPRLSHKGNYIYRSDNQDTPFGTVSTKTIFTN